MKAAWQFKPLGKCALFIDYRGKTPPKTEMGVRLITAKNVKLGFVNDEPAEFVDPDAYDNWMTRGIPRRGDVLFTTEAPLGNVAQLETDGQVMIGQRLITLRADASCLVPDFLKYALLSPHCRAEIFDRATGATVQGIKASLLKNVPIPIPTLGEQKRIVAILDEAFEGLDRARANAEANLADARDLLDEQLDEAVAGRGDRCEVTTLDSICNGFEYGTSAKSQPTGKIPVLRMGNLQSGELDWSNLVYTDDAVDIANLMLQPMDILFNRTNSLEHVGKAAIYRGGQPAIFAGYLIRLHYDPVRVDPEYLNDFLNSRTTRAYGRSISGKSVNQANISAGKLRHYRIALPPLTEQREIVKRIALLRESINGLKNAYLSDLSHISALRQSLLQKAFSGELT